MADIKLRQSNSQTEKDVEHEVSVVVRTEYDEYLGLCEVMMDDKLKKLIRKIEYVRPPQNGTFC